MRSSGAGAARSRSRPVSCEPMDLDVRAVGVGLASVYVVVSGALALFGYAFAKGADNATDGVRGSFELASLLFFGLALGCLVGIACRWVVVSVVMLCAQALLVIAVLGNGGVAVLVWALLLPGVAAVALTRKATASED